MKRKFITILVTVSFLVSCGPSRDIDKTKETFLPGFIMMAAPNSLDKPGTLFAVDKNGVSQPLGSINVNVITGITVVGQTSGKKQNEVGALVNFLGSQKIDVTADANFQNKKNIEYKVSLDGALQDRIELLSAKTELTKGISFIKDFFNKNDISKYKFYLITEAVKANKLDFAFNKAVVGEEKLDATILKIVNANQNVKWDTNRDFQLSYDLGSPLYVFYKVYNLNVETQATGETALSLGQQATAIR